MNNSRREENGRKDEEYSFIRKVLISVAVAVSITIMVLFIGYSIQVLLLIFAGILFGIILRSLRDYVHRYLRLPNGLALALVVLLLLSMFGTTIYLLGPRVAQQAQMLYEEIPEKWNEIKLELYEYSWGREIVEEDPQLQDMLDQEQEDEEGDKEVTRGVISLFTLTAGAVAGIVLVIVIAIYIAAEPQIYTNGVLRLFPIPRRDRVVEILDAIAITIQWWIVGQLTSMVILGLLTVVGLWALGMPYFLILGIFTAFMTFIPNLGPIIAAVPTVLVALTVDINTAIYVTIFYTFIQSIEGYFITPMIHREAIAVPPVLILAVQFLLYNLIGFIGVLVAMPLVACIMILVQMVYVEDVLGDSMDEELSYTYTSTNIF